MIDSEQISVAARLWRLPLLWFTFRTPVRRLEYLVSGLLLVPLKFGLDSLLYRSATGATWSWTSYLHPSFNLRFGSATVHTELIWLLALVTLPFLWVGISMTVRRCLDAGLAPGWSLLFFVTAVNYLLMAVLCCLPSRPRLGVVELWTRKTAESGPSGKDVFLAVSAGAAVGLVMTLVSVVLLGSYGLALFVGAPFVMGAVTSFMLNRVAGPGFFSTLALTQLTLLVSCLAILMFAVEGLLCLVMAYPIATVLALMGGLLGRALVGSGAARAPSATGLLLALPLLLLNDAADRQPPLREVLTTVEIDAPPERVWENVIAFPELPPKRHWVFHLGVAHPVAARIVGQGAGAVRYCEFSTGAFVEPITAWEPPARLAFDVVAQPLPMRELTPYRELNAPHLLDGLVSRRGEFRLVALPGGRTRLEGSTWYTLDMFPQGYWALWSDFVIARIHLRVLEHVRDLSELRNGGQARWALDVLTP